MADPVGITETGTACGRRFGSVTLQAPAALNALSLPMVDILQAQLTRWAADPAVVAVVLAGEGERAFCAGGDLRDLYQSMRDCGDASNGYAQQFFSREYRLDYLIHTYPKPLLCWGSGIVMGGGMGLVAGASHRVVTETTRMAMPEVGIGLFPDVGGSWFLNRLPPRTGVFLALTGAPLNAADALFAGLADFFLPSASRAPLLGTMAAAVWSDDPAENAQLLAHLIEAGAEARSSVHDPAARAAGMPQSNLREHFDEIQSLIGHDGFADIPTRLERAAGGETWLGKAAGNLSRGSPTSARLSYTLLQRARHLSLGEVFRMELNVALGCCAHHDFAEGIRALLIDKDRRPRWQPARLQDVDDALIDDHFNMRLSGANPLADLS